MRRVVAGKTWVRGSFWNPFEKELTYMFFSEIVSLMLLMSLFQWSKIDCYCNISLMLKAWEACNQLVVATTDPTTENWIQCWRWSPVHSYESCSVAHEKAPKCLTSQVYNHFLSTVLWGPQSFSTTEFCQLSFTSAHNYHEWGWNDLTLHLSKTIEMCLGQMDPTMMENKHFGWNCPHAFSPWTFLKYPPV